MASNRTRRTFITALPAAASLLMLPGPVMALNVDEARRMVDKLVAAVNAVISSGQSEASMFKSFEAIFVRFADVRYIAQSSLGPAGRRARRARA